MTEIGCFVCDATFESKTSHLKFIGKLEWNVPSFLEGDALSDNQSPSEQIEPSSTGQSPSIVLPG